MIHLRTPAVMPERSWVTIAAAVVLLMLVPAVEAAGHPPMPRIGLPGCNTTCGNVRVPYPFGMGPPGCYLSPGFKLTCAEHGYGSGKPPRLLLGDGRSATFEVVAISLENNTMRVVSHGLHAINMSGGSGRWSLSDTVGGVPYFLLPESNEFILTGCNVWGTLLNNRGIVSGCATFCVVSDNGDGSITRTDGSNSNSMMCSNIGCCRTSIITGSTSYGVKLQLPPSPEDVWEGQVIIAELGWLDLDQNLDVLVDITYEGPLYEKANHLKVPVTLSWMVPHHHAPVDAYMGDACPDDATRSICKSTNSECINVNMTYISPELGGYSCRCQNGYQGNPYLTAGCKDIKECGQKEKHGCFGDCEELPGSFRCRCPTGTHGNYTVPGGCVKTAVDTTSWPSSVWRKVKKWIRLHTGHQNLGLIIGLSVASGPCILLLVLGTLLIIRDLNQRKSKTLRRKFFTQNRGQLLQQLLSHRADIAERMLISLEELEKATNNFDQSRRLGGGGHGTVYKGILSDLHVVAIKKSKIVRQREIDEFINEVAILSQINHKNIVKLHGCCLETEVPLLAYEFISNGTLSDHLHTEAPQSLPWKDRLRIMSEISKALAYLHSSILVPVIHRDIKPSNILLDDALIAKVSDFGASRYIPLDQTGRTTAVQGTMGYLDPTYYYTRQLTESSDVYSFGVLIIELLTRKRPSSCMSSEGDCLVVQFVEQLAEGNVAELLDPQVVEEGGSEVEEVANLAVSCMKLIAGERPTMRQVEMALEALQASKEIVTGDLRKEKDEKIYRATSYPSTSKRPKRTEVTRCTSLEEEFMLSARHPR